MLAEGDHGEAGGGSRPTDFGRGQKHSGPRGAQTLAGHGVGAGEPFGGEPSERLGASVEATPANQGGRPR